jgi:hypothetical protein
MIKLTDEEWKKNWKEFWQQKSNFWSVSLSTAAGNPSIGWLCPARTRLIYACSFSGFLVSLHECRCESQKGESISSEGTSLGGEEMYVTGECFVGDELPRSDTFKLTSLCLCLEKDGGSNERRNL